MHRTGHWLGMDVHDVGDYRIDGQWRQLEPGMTLTVEPGIYFIPQLIHQWRLENRFVDLIDYRKLESYLDFGGVRIEDDVLITATSATVLGTPIPKSVDAVEACCQS